MSMLPLKLRKSKPPTLLLTLHALGCYPHPPEGSWRKWHTVAIAHSSPLQVFDEAELRPQLQNTVWCWWCGDVVLLMNSIRARVKMHRVQCCIPHWSQLSQQLCAVDSLPFPLQGGLTLSVAVSIWFPLQWECCRQRVQPHPSADLGEGEQNRALLGGGRWPCVVERVFVFSAETGEGRHRKGLGAGSSKCWWQNIHPGRQFASWDFNFCLSIPDLC